MPTTLSIRGVVRGSTCHNVHAPSRASCSGVSALCRTLQGRKSGLSRVTPQVRAKKVSDTVCISAAFSRSIGLIFLAFAGCSP